MSFAKIRPRRGTKTEWLEFNPILMEGELGIEYPDTGIGTGLCKFKLGDGFSKWSELVYAFSAENATSIDGGTVTVWNNIQLRRGTTDEWELADPILADGEPVFDLTKGAMKIGDGEHSFNALDYVGYSWEMDNEYDFGDMNEGEIVPGPDDKDYDFGDMGGWGTDWSPDSGGDDPDPEPEPDPDPDPENEGDDEPEEEPSEDEDVTPEPEEETPEEEPVEEPVDEDPAPEEEEEIPEDLEGEEPADEEEPVDESDDPEPEEQIDNADDSVEEEESEPVEESVEDAGADTEESGENTESENP